MSTLESFPPGGTTGSLVLSLPVDAMTERMKAPELQEELERRIYSVLKLVCPGDCIYNISMVSGHGSPFLVKTSDPEEIGTCVEAVYLTRKKETHHDI